MRILTEHLLPVSKQKEALEKLQDPNRRYLFITMGVLGMRIGEATHITPGWFDRENQLLSIPPRQKCSETCAECHRYRKYHKKYRDNHYQPDGYWYPKTKHAVRTIPVLKIEKALNAKLFDGKLRVWDYLMWYFDEYYLDFEPPIMGRHKGWSTIKDLGADIGRRDIFPHALRASAATNLARIGLQIIPLCSVMGWRHFKTAEIYVRLAGTDVSLALDSILGKSVVIEE